MALKFLNFKTHVVGTIGNHNKKFISHKKRYILPVEKRWDGIMGR